MGGPVSFSSSLLCTGAPKAREGRAHPQGAQPRPRPGLLAWRLYAGVRFRPRRRWQQVSDPPTVAAMAEHWAAGGRPCRTDETGRAITAEYSGPSAGPPPWFVYRITPRSATAVSTIEPGGATRWRFLS